MPLHAKGFETRLRRQERFGKKTHVLLLILLFSLGTSASGLAQGVGKFAAPLLRINPNARQVAMGEAFTALANDYNLLRYNVGGLGILRNVKMTVNFHNWIEDTQQGDIEIAVPFRYGVAGFGVAYFNEGNLTALNENFQPTGSIIESNDIMLSFGYGAFINAFGHTLAFGAGTRIIRQDLAGESGTAIGMDVGAVYALTHISFGATLQNLTLSKMKFLDTAESLPEVARGGIAFRIPIGENLKWNIAADVAKIRNENDLRFYAGTEFKISGLLALRGGYKFHDTEASRWGAGFGLTVPMAWLANSSTDIDYAFSPIDAFNSFVHRFSFTFSFGVVKQVQPLNEIDAKRLTQVQKDLEEELRAARAARERMDAAVRDAETRTRQLEEEMSARLERIQRIALTSAGKIEVIPDVNDSTRILVSLRINFDFDQAIIRPGEFETMRKVAEILNTYPESRLLIAGHTDSIGDPDYNIHLSQRRMNSVMDYLIKRGGIAPSRFFWPVAYGESRPVADNSTAAGRARNRRVDFTIITRDEEPEIPQGTAVQSVQALSDTAFAIICNGAISNFTTRELDGGRKLIIDFPGTFNLSKQSTYEIVRGNVQRARIGFHPEGTFTRVVFDLNARSRYATKAVDNSILVMIR